MNWLTIYLRADTPIPVPRDKDGNITLDPHRMLFDYIGPVVTTPGTYDEDGKELTAPVMDKRHHANLYIHPDEPVPEWAKRFVIDAPRNPVRVLAT